MKKLIITFLLALFLASSLGLGIAVGSESSFGKVDSVKGDVSVIRSEAALDAVKEMALQKEDTIKTGDDSSVTVTFNAGITGSLTSNQNMPLNDLFIKSKFNALKKSIKKPASDAAPAKINVDTIGGSRGTEQVEKKSKELKNEHYWDEKVK